VSGGRFARCESATARHTVGADSFMSEGKEFADTSEIGDDELRRIWEIVERDERRERARLEWDNSPQGQAEIKDLLERYDVDDGETEETFLSQEEIRDLLEGCDDGETDGTFLSFDARPFFDYFDSIEFPA
jgi:hypothetical protein